MLRKNIDPKAEAAKRASLSIVWAAAAGVAYLGLIKVVFQLIQTTSNGAGASTYDGGLRALVPVPLSAATTSLSNLAITALPVAAIVAIALGIGGRLRPALPVLGVAQIVAGLVGLAGAVAFFLRVVATSANRNEFLVALGTIVAVSILVRLQRGVRRFYQRSPAIATLFLGVVTIIYLFLTNGTNISSILLSDVDVWLALVAFAIVLYSGVAMLVFGMRAGRGR